jgi:serine/threonine protein kinase
VLLVADPSQSSSVLVKLPLDLAELPPEVLGKLQDRARSPDRRLMVGRYVVVGELGRGGMGVVYEAWDPRIERHVAIKTIEPELVGEEDRDEVIERFKRETKVVGRLHHPAIVTIYDYGEERESSEVPGATAHIYYYVMEYLEGQSLARVLRDRRTLPDVEAVSIVADVAQALHVTHQAGVIHRDIKPSNIFLRHNMQAVLLDFGIAKTNSVALTRQGQILGTPSYLAPERLREKEVAVDGRADIFSLGVLLYTMLTGDAPFVGQDVYDVIDKIAKSAHPKLARSTPSGQSLSRTLDRMLAKRPEDRYPSAQEAADALKHVLHLLKAQLPSTGDLLADGVRIKEPLPDILATEIATPASALPAFPAPDEEDTGRQHLDAQSKRAAELITSPEEKALGSVLVVHDPGRKAAAEEDAPAPKSNAEADALRQTVAAPTGDGLLLPDTAVMKSLDDPELKARASISDREDSSDYPAHSTSNEETTDDQTIANDPVLEAARQALTGQLSSAPKPVVRASSEPVKPSSKPAPAVAPAAFPSKLPLPPLPKPVAPASKHPPSGASAMPSGSGPRAPALSQDAPSKPPLGPPALPKPPSRPLNEKQLAPKSSPRMPSGLGAKPGPPPPPPATFVGAAAEQLDEHPTLDVEETAEDDSKTRLNPRARSKTMRRSPRIEASLIDEDDVVVKPAPLDADRPDELPTQTGFQRPSPPSQASPVAFTPGSSDEVVKVRGESRVQDPAETGTREVPKDKEKAEPPKEDEAAPEGESPRSSAAVARRTFGARAGRARPLVQVRVSGGGSLSSERMRIVRRRGFMLLAAMLAAIAVGLLLGRMKQRSHAALPDQQEPSPMVERPRVSQIAPEEPELVKPRPASELLQDASNALMEGNIPRAERLFDKAARAAPDKSLLRGEALLGRADALLKLGNKEEAIGIYRSVLTELPKTQKAEEAKTALLELGVVVDAPPRAPAVRREPSPRKESRTEEKPREPASGVVPEIATDVSPSMSTDEKCLALASKHLTDPSAAVSAFRKLGMEAPRAPCVFRHLAVQYRKLKDDRGELDAFRRYLELKPDAPDKEKVQERIKSLASQLEGR